MARSSFSDCAGGMLRDASFVFSLTDDGQLVSSILSQGKLFGVVGGRGRGRGGGATGARGDLPFSESLVLRDDPLLSHL